jgi:hypothetical protein
MNIKQLKYNRLKPEERYLFGLFSEITEFVSKKYPNYIFYEKDNVIIFEYNTINKNFNINMNIMEIFLKNRYNLLDTDIFNLVNNVATNYLKIKNIKCGYYLWCFNKDFNYFAIKNNIDIIHVQPNNNYMNEAIKFLKSR